jgi:hypothetical protein
MGADALCDFSRRRAQVVAMDLGASKGHHQSRVLHNVAPYVSGMRGVRALVLVGGQTATERFGEIPLALLDVLGRSVLLRTLDRLRAAGIGEISVISDTDPLPPHRNAAGCKFRVASPANFWEEASQQFRRLGRNSECILVLRLGAWAELDYRAMVKAFRRSGSSVMRAYSRREEALDVFVVSSDSQSEAATLLRGELRDERIADVPYKTNGYVNLLSEPASLRTLALDVFAGESELRPCGRELRPGVWVGGGARVHRQARIVAPAFIGSCSTVRSAAVVTRGSSLEHHSEVDCATVIDNSSVMPYTRIGAGLDVEYSVVGFQQVHSMLRQVTVEIEDPRLIGATTTQFSARTLTFAGWLLGLLPNVLWNFLFEPTPEAVLESASNALGPSNPAIGEPSLAPVESQTESYREMAARRYGNQ